jgi:hypothetical protein
MVKSVKDRVRQVERIRVFLVSLTPLGGYTRVGRGEGVSMGKHCILASSLFLLILAAGIGMLPAREAAAQSENPNCTDPDIKLDLTCKGLQLASQADPYWANDFVDQNYIAAEPGTEPKATQYRCGCFLALLSTAMNYLVADEGGHPHYIVNSTGINRYGWDTSYHFTPEYLDRYLSYGPDPETGAPLPNWWGYHEKETEKCGTLLHPYALTRAAKPTTIIQDAAVNVTNAAPAATFKPSSPVDEGSTFNLSLDDPSDVSKPDENAGFTYAFDCGSGYGAFSPENEASCSTDDNGTRAVKGKIRDADGGTTEYAGSVDVNNVAPKITGISVAPQALTGKAVSFEGSATDPSPTDTAAGFSWQWAVDGGAYSPGPNPFEHAFSSCGDHTVSAMAEDKDGGISDPATSGVISVYEAHFRQPLDEGVYNTLQRGRVVPVKVSIGCGGNDLTGLKPAIQLLKGDRSAGTETSSDEVETLSSSAADTTGVMRPVGNGYIYNLKVPSDAQAGDLLTVRVRPFGDGNLGTGMYVVLKIR